MSVVSQSFFCFLFCDTKFRDSTAGKDIFQVVCWNGPCGFTSVVFVVSRPLSCFSSVAISNVELSERRGLWVVCHGVVAAVQISSACCHQRTRSVASEGVDAVGDTHDPSAVSRRMQGLATTTNTSAASRQILAVANMPALL